MLSSNGTTLQVDQATHTEAFGDFPQLRAAGREETAQQPIPAKLLDLNLPTLALQPSRSKIPASSAEINVCPFCPEPNSPPVSLLGLGHPDLNVNGPLGSARCVARPRAMRWSAGFTSATMASVDNEPPRKSLIAVAASEGLRTTCAWLRKRARVLGRRVKNSLILRTLRPYSSFNRSRRTGA